MALAPAADALAHFYLAWTLKEAWFKHAPNILPDGYGFFQKLETTSVSDKSLRNAWACTADEFTLALVAPSVKTLHVRSDVSATHQPVQFEDWRVVYKGAISPP